MCPFMQRDVSEVCHKCVLYTSVRGKNPATGADIDDWNCAIAFLPVTTLEGARQARSGAAATESLRNVIVKGQEQRDAMAQTLAALPLPKLLG